MKKRTGAIIQTGQQEYMGISFALDDKEVSDVQVYEKQSLGDLKQSFEGTPYGITLDNSSGYLLSLTFPFSGKRKIGMVIKAEMEELLPFPAEDMVMDFKEMQRGVILAAAVHKTVAMEANGDKKLRYLGLQSLSALYALRWAGRLPPKDFVFVHLNGNAVVIFGVRDGKVGALRQFVHGKEDRLFEQALDEIIHGGDRRPEVCVLVCDSEDGEAWKERINKIHDLVVDIPLLDETIGASALPKWLWSGFGAALIALTPKGEVNLTAEKQTTLPSLERRAFRATGCLAALSILVWSIFWLDYHLKQGSYDYLESQPAAIYKSVFPKSPPIKDVTRAFQEKIKGLERQSVGVINGVSALELLNELSDKIDPQIDVKVNDFTVDEKELTFSGTTVSFAAVEKIKGAVEKVRGVSGVDLQNVELAASRQVKFKIRGKL